MKNPDIVETVEGFQRKGVKHKPEEVGDFFGCYELIQSWPMETVQSQLWKLGKWPYERVVCRVLDWEEAVTRLKDDAQSMCCMTRMLVAIEDQHGNLYLVRTPDLVSGIPEAHKMLREAAVREALNAAFKLN